jgi:hypothetical protein
MNKKIIDQIQKEIQDAIQQFRCEINNGQTRAAVRNSIMCVLMDNVARGNLSPDPKDEPLVDINHEIRLKHKREQLQSLQNQFEDALETKDLYLVDKIRSKMFHIAYEIGIMKEEIQDPNRLNVTFLDPETLEPWIREA